MISGILACASGAWAQSPAPEAAASCPASSVQSDLHAAVQVWQPTHLFRSITIAIWRDMGSLPFGKTDRSSRAQAAGAYFSNSTVQSWKV